MKPITEYSSNGLPQYNYATHIIHLWSSSLAYIGDWQGNAWGSMNSEKFQTPRFTYYGIEPNFPFPVRGVFKDK